MPVSDPSIISCSEFKSLAADSAILIDVREPEEVEEIKIPGCLEIPLGELSFRAAPALAEIPEARNKPIIVYCAHGIRSLYGIQILHGLGYSQARSLSGGIAELYDLES
jgi:rhodanese-related sulfurtransferase